MDELRTRLDELKQQTFDAQEEVAAALELGDRNRQIALSVQVDAIGERYRQLLSAAAPGEHELTLIPSETGSFSLRAVEVFNLPLSRK